MTTESRCADCGRVVEVCACCENAACAHPICYADLIVLTGQSLPQPHTHGG